MRISPVPKMNSLQKSRGSGVNNNNLKTIKLDHFRLKQKTPSPRRLPEKVELSSSKEASRAMTPNYSSKTQYKSKSVDQTSLKPKKIFNTANKTKLTKKKKEFDPWNLSKAERTPTFVAMTAPENRVMLLALLKRLKWKRV